MINKHDEKAKQKGIKIVHMCGFDSIPSDLGTLLVADHMKKQYNKYAHPAAAMSSHAPRTHSSTRAQAICTCHSSSV